MSVEDVLRFVNVVGSGVVAGGLVIGLVALIPTVRRLAPEAGLAVKRHFDPPLDRLIPPTLVVSVLSAVAILIFADGLPTATVVLTALGIAGSIVLIALSVTLSVPMEHAMRDLPEHGAEGEFTALFERWSSLHAVRTAAALLAFACYVGAPLAGSGP